MAVTNRQRVDQALELLNRGLLPYVEREMKSVYGAAKWEKQAILALGDRPLLKAGNWDTPALLSVMIGEWQNVFKRGLGQTERSIVGEMRDIRNRWAHQEVFTSDDTYRVFDNVHRLLTAIGAKEAIELDRQKQELLRIRFEEQAKKETVKAAVAAVETGVSPSSGLKPWREVITPHPDVHSGRYQQAEFAADLGQVHRNEGSDEYRDPSQFFQRTYITLGLRTLLSGALQRLSGMGGDPIVELQTNFGGGKTHSMIALYHFFSGVSADKLRDIEPVLAEAKLEKLPKANRAVLVGQELPLAEPIKKKDGTVVRTMWGELAWQLLKKEGYELVAEADRKGVSPGSTALRELFTLAEPCLVLIDEWVAHARQLVGKDDLPAGTFDSNFSFAQELTEAARACKKTLVVASVPASDDQHERASPWVEDIEVGGEAGRTALKRLENVFGRMQSPWRPASAEESFEIVRRRLFQPMTADVYKHRDAVIRAFGDTYNTQKSEFPSGCSEGDYRRRMESSYPLHPELFDRLYEDWSSLQRFQRTRGVLRLMAAVIHALWRDEDKSLLIMPASVTLYDSATVNELMLYLDDALRPVVEREVDGTDSLPLGLDKENPNFGRLSAARRVARTIFMGTAPRLRSATKGIEDKRIILGCVQPGEIVATFRDALRRLADRASHLYVNENRYWFDTSPSINRTAQDRAEGWKADVVHKEIEDRLRVEAKTRGDFDRVQVIENASQSGDVPDERDVRLVIIGPEAPHTKGSTSSAMTVAQTVLEQRGNSPRSYKNALVFLAAESKALDSLEQAVRTWLAWKSIDAEKETMDSLSMFQRRQVETKLKDSESAVHARIPETYTWLLVPEQQFDEKERKVGPLTWREVRVTGSDHLSVRASKKMVNDGMLIATHWAPVLLRMELDRIPLWRGDHVSVKQLADDFATYVYLPRLRNADVLLNTISAGASAILWEKDTFAYADVYHEETKEYGGLIARSAPPSVDMTGIVVRSEIARTQITRDTPVTPVDASNPTSPTQALSPGSELSAVPSPEPSIPTRFWANLDVDALRMPREAGQIAEAVVAHLNGLVGAKVRISVEIEARVPDGIPDSVQRTVSENCRTLKIDAFGFEEK
ncbi:MAG TPA: Swt1 family HEPN domain-containing protein [Thermoanaerobaculia bacterium]|nr:Swt1 family HEPN domain-containing protein [Thermoanaerobaculia bacterium]